MKPDWNRIRREWRERNSPLDSEALLKLRMTAGAETAHAAAVAQEVLPMVARWMQRAFPSAKYPPVGVPKALVALLLRHGMPVYRRHLELADWGVTWPEFLTAQSEPGMYLPAGQTFPDLWTVFNSIGIDRYNRWNETSVQNVDGRRVRMMSAGAVRGMMQTERWAELVERWAAGKNVLTETLLSCPELSPETAILLEAHMIDGAFLIADRAGLKAMEAGMLPEPKMRGALELLDELERDKYTCRRFYDAVKEKGALL